MIDATVPLATAIGGKPTRLIGVAQGSAAQQAAELVPDGVDIVSALHTVSASKLTDLAHALDEDVLVCGDRKDPKAAADRADRPHRGPARDRLRPARARRASPSR